MNNIKSFFKSLDIDETLKMIDIIMAAQNDYKNVSSIIPLFEVTILKLVATKKDGSYQQVEKPVPEIKEEPIKPQVEPEKKIDPVISKPVEEVPISLLDQPEEEEAKEPEIVLSKDVLVIKNIRKEDSFYIDDDLMIDVMVISKKDIKNQLIDNWPSLKKIIAHPTLGKAATLLVDGRPLVASNKVLVVEYQFPSAAEKANLIINQENIQNAIQSVFGKKMFVYGVSRKDSVRWQQNYMNKYQLNKLPKPDTVSIDFEGE